MKGIIAALVRSICNGIVFVLSIGNPPQPVTVGSSYRRVTPRRINR